MFWILNDIIRFCLVFHLRNTFPGLLQTVCTHLEHSFHVLSHQFIPRHLQNRESNPVYDFPTLQSKFVSNRIHSLEIVGIKKFYFLGVKKNLSFYRPQRSWAKVMFLQASVILLMGGCLPHYPREQTPPRSRHPPGADTPQEQTPHREQTLPLEQTPPRSRHPPPEEQTPADGQRAAATHPTGMHSC